MATGSGIAVFGVVTCLYMFVGVAWGGECCSSYTDLLGNSHSAQWCPVYCCGLSKALKCCDVVLLRAGDSYREDFCFQWFTNSINIWAPIVIGVLALIVLIGCIVCCVRCCR